MGNVNFKDFYQVPKLKFDISKLRNDLEVILKSKNFTDSQNDLLKKSEQVPVDQEQHFLLEDLYKSVEKMEETQEMNMTNKVNIEFLRDQLEKALKDIEDLKDKVRANGNGAH